MRGFHCTLQYCARRMHPIEHADTKQGPEPSESKPRQFHCAIDATELLGRSKRPAPSRHSSCCPPPRHSRTAQLGEISIKSTTKIGCFKCRPPGGDDLGWGSSHNSDPAGLASALEHPTVIRRISKPSADVCRFHVPVRVSFSLARNGETIVNVALIESPADLIQRQEQAQSFFTCDMPDVPRRSRRSLRKVENRLCSRIADRHCSLHRLCPASPASRTPTVVPQNSAFSDLNFAVYPGKQIHRNELIYDYRIRDVDRIG